MKPLTLFIIVFAAGCAATLPNPTSEDIESFRTIDPSITIETVRNARDVYVVKCSGCHSLYLPSSYRPEQWPKILEDMGMKAKTSTEENEKILFYVCLYSMRNSKISQDSVLSKVGMELETK